MCSKEIDVEAFRWCKDAEKYKAKEAELKEREEKIREKEEYLNVLLFLSILLLLICLFGAIARLRGAI